MPKPEKDKYDDMRDEPLVKWIEKHNYGFFRRIYKLLLNRYYIDAFYCKVAEGVKRLSEVLYKRVELGSIDRLNYCIAEITVKFSQKYRKIQTGNLTWNMALIILGALMLILTLLFGGMLK